MLRGAEVAQSYLLRDAVPVANGEPLRLKPGDVQTLSPTAGDIHQVSNATETDSISIHVYGADIGAVNRSVFTSEGKVKPFISGYSNNTLPNIWGAN